MSIYGASDIIRHALTGGQNTGVYRRHYVVSRGAPHHAVLDRMVAEGLMTLFDDGKMEICYHVTAMGAVSVGLNSRQGIANA